MSSDELSAYDVHNIPYQETVSPYQPNVSYIPSSNPCFFSIFGYDEYHYLANSQLCILEK